MTRVVPSAEVVRLFGGHPSLLTPLPGGEGRAWRAGAVVLKPAESERRIEWVASFLASLDPGDRFRVERPRRAHDGRWVVSGWSATSWLEGERVRGAWEQVLDVSAAFHAEARRSRVLWPDFMRRGEGPWATGDRVAWGEEPWDASVSAPVARVLAATESLRGVSGDSSGGASGKSMGQVIHGDLGGNVLFADSEGLPPAVIDVSPFFRPAAFADAIVVADAMAWDGAPASLAAEFVRRWADGRSLLARAIVFRVVAAACQRERSPGWFEVEVEAYEALLTLVA